MKNSDFLENLKKAVDEGEFNSDAAKLINDIDELAGEKGNNIDELQERINERIDESGKKDSLNEDEVKSINEVNEKFISEITEVDVVNSHVATMLDMEKLVNESILDFISHIKIIENQFFNDKKNNSKYEKLYDELTRIKNKFKDFY